MKRTLVIAALAASLLVAATHWMRESTNSASLRRELSAAKVETEYMMYVASSPLEKATFRDYEFMIIEDGSGVTHVAMPNPIYAGADMVQVRNPETRAAWQKARFAKRIRLKYRMRGSDGKHIDRYWDRLLPLVVEK